MKIMIVYGREIDKNVNQLVEASRKLGHNTIPASIMDLSAYIGPEGSRFLVKNRAINNLDICFLRSLGPGTHEQINRRINIIEHLEFSGVLVINPVRAFRRARDKYATLCMLARRGLPVPRTLVTESSLQAYKFMKSLRKAVYKPLIGSMGYGSLKLEDPDLAYNAFRLLERIGQPIYIQEYIPAKRDVRAFVVGNHLLAAMHRLAPGGRWKTNVAQGGKVKPAKLSAGTAKLAVRAAQTLELEYAGVDLIETAEGPVILEVNSSPSWQGLQKVTGINIVERLIKYAVEKAGRN